MSCFSDKIRSWGKMRLFLMSHTPVHSILRSYRANCYLFSGFGQNMKFHAIAFTLLVVCASFAGCTADEALIVDNETTNGCTVLLQIEETAKHSPGNTSWTNHTYDSNCGKINSTTTGLFDKIGKYIVPGDYRHYTAFIEYDSSGNIAFHNSTLYNGWENYSTNELEYQYDANGNLLSIVQVPKWSSDFPYENYSYDSAGREIMVTVEYSEDVWWIDTNNRTKWKNTTYNSDGKISKISVAGAVKLCVCNSEMMPTPPKNLTYHYDSNNLLSYTIASYHGMDPVYTNYTYDSQERVIQVKSETEDVEIFINTSYDASGQISEEIETWSSKPGSKREIDWHFTRTFTWDQIEIESETYAQSDTESDLEADTEAGP